jgi:hypothetical protein
MEILPFRHRIEREKLIRPQPLQSCAARGEKPPTAILKVVGNRLTLAEFLVSALAAKQRLSVAVSNLRGDLWHQPGAIAGHDVAVDLPALVDPGVGAEQEAIGIARA